MSDRPNIPGSACSGGDPTHPTPGSDDGGNSVAGAELGSSPTEPRTYTAEQMAHAVRSRLERAGKQHQAQLSAVAERAAAAAIARAREQHELELGQIFHDLGLEPGDLHRIRRERRAFERAAENGAFRRGPRALKMRIG